MWDEVRDKKNFKDIIIITIHSGIRQRPFPTSIHLRIIESGFKFPFYEGKNINIKLKCLIVLNAIYTESMKIFHPCRK
jgi:hypothetical protein